ncbi:MAG: type I phosphomannose isomerase catalytic subunit [Muribaculaceae bacterium]
MIPFLLKPYLKPVTWGGSRLSSFKGLDTRLDHIGESWEVSTMPGCESIIETGEFEGYTLTEACCQAGAKLLGKEIVERFGTTMPLLVKFIDAADDLSIQVHPNDALARRRHGCNGKCEMWYIIQADPGARLIPGFSTAISKSEYKRHAAAGTLDQVLASCETHPGDVFYIPAGRVHAIGRGNLLLEVQQASDITYRIFDYNRRDAYGNLRRLHQRQALDAIDFTCINDYHYYPRGERLADTPHFHLERVALGAELPHRKVEARTFIIATAIAGRATARCGRHSLPLDQGHTLLIPANTEVTISGEATIILITP